MKKRILSIALVVAMLAIAITGGTLAYLKDSEGAKNVMTAGKVEIEQVEVFNESTAKIIPVVENTNGTIDNKIQKNVTVKNTGTESAFVRTIFLSEKSGDNLIHFDTINGGDKTAFVKHTAEVTYNGVQYVVYSYTYEDAIAKNGVTAASLTNVYLDKTAGNEWYDAVGEKYDLFVFSQAVQSVGFDGADEGAEYALDEAFGDIDAEIQNWVNADTVLFPVNP